MINKKLFLSFLFLKSYLLFNIVPTFVDITVAIVYFVIAFNMWFGIIMFCSVGLYLGKIKNTFKAKLLNHLLMFSFNNMYN